jgi:4-aminobutyrate aminotransferase/(S)-3-amino-2-methylpropionate transaminase
VACAAALAAISVMERDDLAGAARRIGLTIEQELGALAGRYTAIAERRGRGAMQAIEFVTPGTLDPDPVVAGAVARACHAQGVVVLTCGTWGNVIRLLPPLSIDEQLLGDGLSVLAESVASVLG